MAIHVLKKDHTGFFTEKHRIAATPALLNRDMYEQSVQVIVEHVHTERGGVTHPGAGNRSYTVKLVKEELVKANLLEVLYQKLAALPEFASATRPNRFLQFFGFKK